MNEGISCSSGVDEWSSPGHHLKRKMDGFIESSASIVFSIPSLVYSSSFSSYMQLAGAIQPVAPWSPAWCLFWLIILWRRMIAFKEMGAATGA